MMEEKLEQELSLFDFSLCHPVRESLLGKLLTMHRRKIAEQHSRRWASSLLDDDDLDWVAAAGTPEGADRNLLKSSEAWKDKP